jgi:hypothetical protein
MVMGQEKTSTKGKHKAMIQTDINLLVPRSNCRFSSTNLNLKARSGPGRSRNIIQNIKNSEVGTN